MIDSEQTKQTRSWWKCRIGLHRWSEWTDSQEPSGAWYRWRVCRRCSEVKRRA